MSPRAAWANALAACAGMERLARTERAVPELGAAALAAARTGRRRVLLSGGLDPRLGGPLARHLADLGLDPDPLPPDPLGIEDLLGRTDEDLGLIVGQAPTLFGGRRDLYSLGAICREMEIGLVLWVDPPAALDTADLATLRGADLIACPTPDGAVLAARGPACAWLPGETEAAAGTLPAAWDDTARAIGARAAALAARLRGRAGLRVVGGGASPRMMVHLADDDADARAVAAGLHGPGWPTVTAAAELFPDWAEFRPVLLLGIGPDTTDAGVAACSAALLDAV